MRQSFGKADLGQPDRPFRFMQPSKPLKYFVYARKSSESEDKQVASIDAQLFELSKMAQDSSLSVVEILTESRSAKAPGRPVFNDMVARIQNGEANGILCWKLNRLARNPIDGAAIQWMLQQGVIQHIQTYGRSYYPNDNVIVMAVELGMANQFIRDLSTDTKRGLSAKVERGWMPGRAPLGYINNRFREKGDKDIIIDKERFPLVRKMWDLLLDKQLPTAQIYDIATDDWGFRVRSGNKMAKSKIYDLFTNPFYYGKFSYRGEVRDGCHQPMITEDEFERAQYILGNRSKRRIRTHDFSYTGLIKCGECGGSIVAEEKHKTQKNGNKHHWVYYRCSKRIKRTCSQKCVRLEIIEAQIAELLGKIQIPPEFCRWALDILKSENSQESEDRTKILQTQRQAYDACLKRIDNLIDLRANGEIEDAEFSRKKSEYLVEKERLALLLADTDSRANSWLDYAERSFNFAETAAARFKTEDLSTKREILQALGSNLTLKDRKLFVDMTKPLSLISESAKEANALYKRLEPQKNVVAYEDIASLYSQSPSLGA